MNRFSGEMSLGPVFNTHNVLDNMTNRTKKAAIEDLIELLWKNKQIENKSEALARVLEREELVSTALGGGVAIPHARLEVGDTPIFAFGRHPAGIDFAANDKEPVHLIFVLLWKPQQPGLMNKLFGGLVSKLAEGEFRNKLLEAKNKTEIVKMLSDVKVGMKCGSNRCEADMLVTLQILETKKRAGSKGLDKQISLARTELPGSLLARFDGLFNRWGEALVEVSNGVCKGCHMHLSTSFASEMLSNPDTVYICEKCGRFIIHHI